MSSVRSRARIAYGSRSLPLTLTDLISVFGITHLVGHWQTNPCCQLPFPLEQAQPFTVSPVVRYPSDWLHYRSQKPNQHSGADKMAQNEPHREERRQAWRMWSANGAECCRVKTIRIGKNRMTAAHAWMNRASGIMSPWKERSARGTCECFAGTVYKMCSHSIWHYTVV